MRVTIAVDRPFHSVMLANALQKHGSEVQILSSAPRKYFRGLQEGVGNQLVPSPFIWATHILRVPLSESLARMDICIFDRAVAAVMPKTDVLIGWATQCESAARRVQSRGGCFLLDRACPHRDAQQAIVERETEMLGRKFSPEPAWFRERQLAEYEMAEAILVPSDYTARSFPDHLRAKLVKAPLMGRCQTPPAFLKPDDGVFTVGVVGGSAIRKGYIYLLRAWEKLNLPNARLLLRGGADFESYPVLMEAMRRLPNVERLGYVPDIGDFFRQCDVFVLPSVDDGFGMALFEAMSHGVPCIATTSCGASELLEAGHEALIVEPAEEESLAQALLRLYESPQLRKEIAANGRAATTRITQSEVYDKAIKSLAESIRDSGAAPQNVQQELANGLPPLLKTRE
jgi:glycosyltransferase involved in cell wall biosynthesis